MNKTVLIGRLTEDPEKRTAGEKEVSNFTLAVDRTFKNANGEKEADFIPIVAWGKTAELCNKYLFKGSQTAISGRIQTRSYEGDDSVRRYVTEVVADEVQFLTPKAESQKNAGKNFDGPGVPMDGIDCYDDFDVSDCPF